MNLLLATVTARLSCFCSVLRDMRQIPQPQISLGWRLACYKQPHGCGDACRGNAGERLLDWLDLGLIQQLHLHEWLSRARAQGQASPTLLNFYCGPGLVLAEANERSPRSRLGTVLSLTLLMGGLTIRSLFWKVKEFILVARCCQLDPALGNMASMAVTWLFFRSSCCQ